MRYKVRDGILLKNICDEWLLIAVGEAAEHCLYVRHVNDTLAWYWQRISQGLPIEEIVAEAESCFEASRAQIKADLDNLVEQLFKAGYLLEK